ncbi:PulJ/GspJ family protein [Deinococcus hohokamensis]|uniref:Type II secretion system protein J n=1 Tax=Deinococcus hohokamensis TaxID=309883 RepID=A0ABV9IEJ9_9DEIO
MRTPVLGLTLVELLVALSILAVVTTAAMTAYVSTLQGNQAAGLRTRASQLLTAVGAQITQHALTLAPGTSTVQLYAPNSVTTALSSPPANCATYLQSATANYCVTISNGGQFNPASSVGSLLATPAEVYTIRACWHERGAVRCAEANTIY